MKRLLTWLLALAGSCAAQSPLLFDGAYSPGNSPGIVALSPQVTFATTNVLTMEIGGLTPGPGTPVNNGYDRLIFAATVPPPVTWGGTLVLDLINSFQPRAGDAFDLFDFPAGRAEGSFHTITVLTHGLLEPGLALDLSELYLTGIVRVSEPPIITDVNGMAVSRTAIQVQATIRPNGGNTTAWVEYGSTPALGSQTPPVGAGNGLAVTLDFPLTSLAAATVYYFRVHAANAAGSVFSAPVQQITTFATRYEEWAHDELGDVTAPRLADHDGDGIVNQDEYALALFPALPAVTEPAGGFHDYPDGRRLRLLFWRPLDRDDVTIEVQSSSSLTPEVWTTIATSVNSAPFTGAGFVHEDRNHPAAQPGMVEVRDTENAAAAARRFLRIRISTAP